MTSADLSKTRDVDTITIDATIENCKDSSGLFECISEVFWNHGSDADSQFQNGEISVDEYERRLYIRDLIRPFEHFADDLHLSDDPETPPYEFRVPENHVPYLRDVFASLYLNLHNELGFESPDKTPDNFTLEESLENLIQLDTSAIHYDTIRSCVELPSADDYDF